MIIIVFMHEAATISYQYHTVPIIQLSWSMQYGVHILHKHWKDMKCTCVHVHMTLYMHVCMPSAQVQCQLCALVQPSKYDVIGMGYAYVIFPASKNE